MIRYVNRFMALLYLAMAPFLFIGCDKEKDDDLLTVKVLNFGDCDFFKETTGEEQWRYELHENTLSVLYSAMWVNCAIENMAVQVEITSGELNILEKEFGDPIANCLCAKPFEYTISEIPNGIYTVNIYRNAKSASHLRHRFRIRVD